MFFEVFKSLHEQIKQPETFVLQRDGPPFWMLSHNPCTQQNCNKCPGNQPSRWRNSPLEHPLSEVSVFSTNVSQEKSVRRWQLLLSCWAGHWAPQALRRISTLIAFLRATRATRLTQPQLELHSPERDLSPGQDPGQKKMSPEAVPGIHSFLPRSHSSNKNEVGVWEFFFFFRNKEME